MKQFGRYLFIKLDQRMREKKTFQGGKEAFASFINAIERMNEWNGFQQEKKNDVDARTNNKKLFFFSDLLVPFDILFTKPFPTDGFEAISPLLMRLMEKLGDWQFVKMGTGHGQEDSVNEIRQCVLSWKLYAVAMPRTSVCQWFQPCSSFTHKLNFLLRCRLFRPNSC